MKSVIFFFLTSVTLMLTSCIDGEEEITIRDDGSAKLRAMYSLPSLILSDADASEFREQIENEVGKDEKVNLLTNTVEKVRGKQVITIELETADLRNLENLLSQKDDGNGGHSDEQKELSKSDLILNSLLGDLGYKRDGLAVAAQRRVNLAPLLDKYAGDRWHSVLGDSEFRYIIHFPKALQSSNAHELTNGGKTALWRYRLADCKDGPFEMDIVAAVPLPWWVFVGGGLLVLLILFVLWRLVSIVKRRS